MWKYHRASILRFSYMVSSMSYIDSDVLQTVPCYWQFSCVVYSVFLFLDVPSSEDCCSLSDNDGAPKRTEFRWLINYNSPKQSSDDSRSAETLRRRQKILHISIVVSKVLIRMHLMKREYMFEFSGVVYEKCKLVFLWLFSVSGQFVSYSLQLMMTFYAKTTFVRTHKLAFVLLYFLGWR